MNLGTNIEATITGTKLTIVIDLEQRHGISASGKSTIVATTSGNKTVPGTNVKIGLNAYVGN